MSLQYLTWLVRTILRGGTFRPDESVLFFEFSSSSSEWSRLGAFFGLFVTDNGLFRSAATSARALAPPTLVLSTFSVEPPRVPRRDFADSFRLVTGPADPAGLSSRLCFFFLKQFTKSKKLYPLSEKSFCRERECFCSEVKCIRRLLKLETWSIVLRFKTRKRFEFSVRKKGI